MKWCLKTSLSSYPDYLTWSLVATIGTGIPSTANIGSLPDFTPQPNSNYTDTLSITTAPLEIIDQTRVYQFGFGLHDSKYDGKFPDGSHPGFDFFSVSAFNTVVRLFQRNSRSHSERGNTNKTFLDRRPWLSCGLSFYSTSSWSLF